MLGGDVHGAVEPCDRPAVEGEAGEHILVAQRGEKLVLRDERLAVEDDAAAVVEVQLQQVVAHDAGGSDPFQSVCLFHIVSIKGVNLSQRLTVLHALPVFHQFVLVNRRTDPADHVTCVSSDFLITSLTTSFFFFFLSLELTNFTLLLINSRAISVS